jgi:hypothetical protein
MLGSTSHRGGKFIIRINAEDSWMGQAGSTGSTTEIYRHREARLLFLNADVGFFL